jgi:very-short-patch-repair endonuclease
LQERARRLRHDLTETESVLWRALRGEQLLGHKFRRQQTIGPYIVDFVDVGTKLIVELDGGQHADAVDYDTKRDAWLVSEGFRVLRFWNNEVMENLEGVLMNIAAALSPPPQPLSPARGTPAGPRFSEATLPQPLEGEGEKQTTTGMGEGDKFTATLEGEGRTT